MMERWWGDALARQFSAAIDMLENAVLACPAALWTARLWPQPPPPWFPAEFSEFWYVSYHTLVWLDLYGSGLPEEEFAPPDPFAPGEVDSIAALPARPYTRDEVLTYLAATRQTCQTRLAALTEVQARRPVAYPWTEGQEISYLELQLYNLRHVQEHAAQLSLFLGQQASAAADLGWVSGITGDAGER